MKSKPSQRTLEGWPGVQVERTVHCAGIGFPFSSNTSFAGSANAPNDIGTPVEIGQVAFSTNACSCTDRGMPPLGMRVFGCDWLTRSNSHGLAWTAFPSLESVALTVYLPGLSEWARTRKLILGEEFVVGISICCVSTGLASSANSTTSLPFEIAFVPRKIARNCPWPSSFQYATRSANTSAR